MTTISTRAVAPRLWLVGAGVLSALSIAILWPLQQVGQVCILSYPAPPGCAAEEPRWVPIAAIAAIIALFCTAIVFAVVSAHPRTAIIVLSGAIVGTVLIAVAVVALSQTGVWDAPHPIDPYVIID